MQHKAKELEDRVKLADELSDKVHALTAERKRRDEEEDNANRARNLERLEFREQEERLRAREKQHDEAAKARERDWEERVRRLEAELMERTRRHEEDFMRKREELEARVAAKTRELQEERDRWHDEKQQWMNEVESRRGGGGRSNRRPAFAPAGVSAPTYTESAWASGPLPRDRMSVRG